MIILNQYRRLNLWGKLGVWGSLASIISFAAYYLPVSSEKSSTELSGKGSTITNSIKSDDNRHPIVQIGGGTITVNYGPNEKGFEKNNGESNIAERVSAPTAANTVGLEIDPMVPARKNSASEISESTKVKDPVVVPCSVWNDKNEAVPGSKITLFKIDAAGSAEEVASGESDAHGNITIKLSERDCTYRIIVKKSGYRDFIWNDVGRNFKKLGSVLQLVPQKKGA